MNVLDVRQPNIVVHVSQEFGLHLQHLNLTDLLQIVANLEALFEAVELVPFILKEGKFIRQLLVIEVYFCIS